VRWRAEGEFLAIFEAVKLDCTNLIFVEPGAKNQRAVLPRRVADAEAAAAICSIAGDVFVFQQDNAPAHRASDTVASASYDTPVHQS